VQPRPLDRDVDLTRRSGNPGHLDEALVEVEESQQVDEIALEKAPAPQVIKLALREAQVAQRANLVLDLRDKGRQVDVGIAAFEPVLDLRLGEMMLDHLHHRELVEVGVEQRLDDHRQR
jgi:hypothetical protein